MNSAMKATSGYMCTILNCKKRNNRLFSHYGFKDHLISCHNFDVHPHFKDVNFAERHGIFIKDKNYKGVEKRIRKRNRKYQNIAVTYV